MSDRGTPFDRIAGTSDWPEVKPPSALVRRNPFTPECDYIQHLLRDVERLDAQATNVTSIGRDYRDHAHLLRQSIHLHLCYATGIGHAACRGGFQTCPVFLAAVAVHNAPSSMPAESGDNH